jgi:hypothetical protein
MEILSRQQVLMAFNSLFDTRERECGGTRSALSLPQKSSEGTILPPSRSFFTLLPGCRVQGFLPDHAAGNYCYGNDPLDF